MEHSTGTKQLYSVISNPAQTAFAVRAVSGECTPALFAEIGAAQLVADAATAGGLDPLHLRNVAEDIVCAVFCTAAHRRPRLITRQDLERATSL